MWTVPEASYYGLTLAKAREQGLACDEGVARFEDCLRGRVFAPRGLLKLVFETGTGRIVGVHIVGDDAAEMIHYGMLLVQSGATLGSVITTVYVAVTYHELLKVAALDGNAKLEFGLQWQTNLAGLGASGPAMLEAVESGALAAEFAKLDTDGSANSLRPRLRMPDGQRGSTSRPACSRTSSTVQSVQEVIGRDRRTPNLPRRLSSWVTAAQRSPAK